MSSSKTKKSADSVEKAEKKSDDIEVSEIHTANDWEHADLGDEQRKKKFLRLMGAKKRKDEHKNETKNDDTNPEKKHCRSKEQDDSINRELEKQFTEGLHSKIAHQRHGGLGFQGDAPSSSDWRQQAAKTNFVRAADGDDESTKSEEKKKKSKS